MQRTRVKICGISRVEDALAAARAGADAIGLAFHPAAPRHVSRERARQIVAELPPFVTPVALFVDAPSRMVLDVAEELRLRHVQLHGHETPEQVAELRGLTVLKAVRVEADRFAAELAAWRDAVVTLGLAHLKGLVLETAGTKQAGGTGQANDWQTVRRHREGGHFDGLPATIAAGGLNPQTVGAVVREIRPWAVDVSSGVEIYMGHKSPEKMAAFVEAVRAVDGERP